MSFNERKLIKERIKREKGNIFRQGGYRVAMLYPSPYNAGMSSLGYQWIISRLQQAGMSVERFFLPDNPKKWKGPLLSYETQTPLSHFPVIGISLAYELELAGLIQCLEMSGIPALREERNDSRIILGGPLTFSNPLPSAPFVDAILLGEAEEIAGDAFLSAFHASRDEWFSALRSLPGTYIPEEDKEKLPVIAKASDEMLPARSHIISPDAELSNMMLIEGERGCHRSCTFCVMRRSTNGGMRLVTPERVLSLVPDYAPRVGLVGAAISDHPKLPQILDALIKNGKGVGVSSLRADRIARKPIIAKLLREGGYKTLTVASDAASHRLRKTISKGTLEKHLISCAEQASEHKYKLLKVYMMLGLPGENDSDIEELIRFCIDISKIHPMVLGIAPFVPKKNTPMDVDAFAGIKVVQKRLKYLEKGLRVTKGRAQLRSTSVKWAWIEYMLAQGGHDMGHAVLNSVHNGGNFASWKRAILERDTSLMSPWRKKIPIPLSK